MKPIVLDGTQFLGCTNPAEFEIYPKRQGADAGTLACADHAGKLLPSDGWSETVPYPNDPSDDGKALCCYLEDAP